VTDVRLCSLSWLCSSAVCARNLTINCNFIHYSFTSENGHYNAQIYYRLTRPLAGRSHSHQPSATTEAGYHFDTYTKTQGNRKDPW
jgi:hypothetical protein